MLVNVSKPYRMMEYKYSRSSSYYEDRVLAREHGSRASDECVISEGYDSVGEGYWEFDESDILNRRAYNNEGVTMFCVFEYETKELIKRSDNGETMLYSSLRHAYEDQEDVIDSEDEFNAKFLIFEVPEIKKTEVKPDVAVKAKTFAGALKKTSTEGGWHTNQ